MRIASTATVLVTMLFALPVANLAVGQETTRQDFKKWYSQVQGRWIGDVTWVTDWPGLGKKGDNVTAYWRGRVSQDDNVMVINFFGGNGSETGLMYYDAAAKRTRGTFVSSGGTVGRLTNWPHGDKWIETVDVTLPDGTKGRIKSVFVFTADGKTVTILRNGKVGDDVIKDQKDIWRRVSPANQGGRSGQTTASSQGDERTDGARSVVGQETTSEDFKKWCSQHQGRWICDVTWVADWPGGGKKGDKVTGYWRGHVAEDGNVMVTNFLGGSGSDIGLVYYDAAAKRIQATHVSSGGTVFQTTIWPDGDKWREAVDVTLADGTKGKFDRTFVYADSGRTLTIHINGKLGDEVITDQKDVARRVSPDEPTK